MKALSLFLFLITSTPLAMGQDMPLLPTKTITLENGSGGQWIVKSYNSDIDHPTAPNRIKVYIKTPPNLLFDYPNGTASFNEVEVINLSKYPRPLLATRWTHGVNTVCLLIFDPSLKKKAYLTEFCSKDLDWKVKDDHIDITEFDYGNDDNTPLVEMKSQWKPDDLIKVAPQDNP